MTCHGVVGRLYGKDFIGLVHRDHFNRVKSAVFGSLQDRDTSQVLRVTYTAPNGDTRLVSLSPSGALVEQHERTETHRALNRPYSIAFVFTTEDASFDFKAHDQWITKVELIQRTTARYQGWCYRFDEIRSGKTRDDAMDESANHEYAISLEPNYTDGYQQILMARTKQLLGTHLNGEQVDIVLERI